MDNPPSVEPKDQTAETPEPEVLAPRTDDVSLAAETPPPPPSPTKPGRRRRTFRPSHKATFIGLAVVAVVLAINAGIIAFVLKGQAKTKGLDQGQVSISQGVLDKLGVNRSSIGDTGIELVVGPNARFDGRVKVGGDVSVAGQLKLSNKFSAPDASLAQLEAGNTAVSALNVNGDGTVSNLNLRNNLLVTGTTHLQGAVTVSQLLTVNNSLNVSGNLSVGGALSVGTLNIFNLNIGGHLTTSGSAPNIGPGNCVGANGTVSISGNDAAGTVAVNTGTGACSGTLANVAFHNHYATTPHVVITPVGRALDNFFITRTSSGFTINGSPASSAGYAFDYIVEQ